MLELGSAWSQKVKEIYRFDVRNKPRGGRRFRRLNCLAPLKWRLSLWASGTVPGCTGCDHDDFVGPGAGIEISIDEAQDAPTLPACHGSSC